MSREEVIKVTHLSKSFTLRTASSGPDHMFGKELRALDDVSFSVYRGESIGVFGLNGSGKSTLLKVLSGITRPGSGTVEVKGRLASILDIGAGFHPELSGHENIFLNAQLLGFHRKDIQHKYAEIVAFSGVERFIHEPVKNYSNGMYLRLAFSIMAHLDFDIYLFDEVMHVGDAAFVLRAQRKIQALTESQKTVIIVSHNLNDLGNCDRLIELHAGRVKQISTQKDVLSKYVMESVKENNVDILTKNSVVGAFNNDKLSSKAELKQVRIWQQENSDETWLSSLPLTIEICYEKLGTSDTLDVLLVVSDSSGVIVFVSTPFINGLMSEATAPGTYKAVCEIPASFLSTNIYAVGITFVKNARSLRDADMTAGAAQLENMLEQYGVVASYPKAFYFSVRVVMNNFTDLGRFTLPVGYLFPGLKWEYPDETNNNKHGQ